MSADSTTESQREQSVSKSEARVAMLQLAESVGVDDVNAQTDMVETAMKIGERFEDMQERLTACERQLAAIQDLGREKSTKAEKMAAIIQFAKNKATDPENDRVLLRPKDIQGAAGVKERYSYTLVDDLPTEHECFLNKADVSQYGELEIDKSSQRKALIVDLALAQQNDGSLCLHNNSNDGSGGR